VEQDDSAAGSLFIPSILPKGSFGLPPNSALRVAITVTPRLLGQKGATGATLLIIRHLRCYIWCYIWCYMGATWVLHGCYMGATWVLHFAFAKNWDTLPREAERGI